MDPQHRGSIILRRTLDSGLDRQDTSSLCPWRLQLISKTHTRTHRTYTKPHIKHTPNHTSRLVQRSPCHIASYRTTKPQRQAHCAEANDTIYGNEALSGRADDL